MSFQNLSPSPHRLGRACVCVWHQGKILMVAEESGGWTFPGGGVHSSETFEQAALREAWEEAGARVRVGRFLFAEADEGGVCECYLADLELLQPSPEGRAVRWVDPHQSSWCKDRQIRPALAALGRSKLGLSKVR